MPPLRSRPINTGIWNTYIRSGLKCSITCSIWFSMLNRITSRPSPNANVMDRKGSLGSDLAAGLASGMARADISGSPARRQSAAPAFAWIQLSITSDSSLAVLPGHGLQSGSLALSARRHVRAPALDRPSGVGRRGRLRSHRHLHPARPLGSPSAVLQLDG